MNWNFKYPNKKKKNKQKTISWYACLKSSAKFKSIGARLDVQFEYSCLSTFDEKQKVLFKKYNGSTEIYL